jgi:hypothetical protein
MASEFAYSPLKITKSTTMSHFVLPQLIPKSTIDSIESWRLKLYDPVLSHPRAISHIHRCIKDNVQFIVKPNTGAPTLVVRKWSYRSDSNISEYFFRLELIAPLIDIAKTKDISILKMFRLELESYHTFITECLPIDIFVRLSVNCSKSFDASYMKKLYAGKIVDCLDVYSLDNQNNVRNFLIHMMQQTDKHIEQLIQSKSYELIKFDKVQQIHSFNCSKQKCMADECENLICGCTANLIPYYMNMNGIGFNADYTDFRCYDCMKCS